MPVLPCPGAVPRKRGAAREPSHANVQRELLLLVKQGDPPLTWIDACRPYCIARDLVCIVTIMHNKA